MLIAYLTIIIIVFFDHSNDVNSAPNYLRNSIDVNIVTRNREIEHVDELIPRDVDIVSSNLSVTTQSQSNDTQFDSVDDREENDQIAILPWEEFNPQIAQNISTNSSLIIAINTSTTISSSLNDSNLSTTQDDNLNSSEVAILPWEEYDPQNSTKNNFLSSESDTNWSTLSTPQSVIITTTQESEPEFSEILPWEEFDPSPIKNNSLINTQISTTATNLLPELVTFTYATEWPILTTTNPPTKNPSQSFEYVTSTPNLVSTSSTADKWSTLEVTQIAEFTSLNGNQEESEKLPWEVFDPIKKPINSQPETTAIPSIINSPSTPYISTQRPLLSTLTTSSDENPYAGTFPLPQPIVQPINQQWMPLIYYAPFQQVWIPSNQMLPSNYYTPPDIYWPRFPPRLQVGR